MQMCYCSKHAHLTGQKKGKTIPEQQKLAIEPPFPISETQNPSPRLLDNVLCSNEPVTEAAGSAARMRPFNHAVRRGMRAPEAIECGLAKRKFLQQTPYLVSHRSMERGAAKLSQPLDTQKGREHCFSTDESF